MKYVFKGNAPFEYTDEEGSVLLVVHPLDTADFDEEPGAPWELVKGPGADEPAADIPPAKAPAEPDVVITPDGPRKPSTDGM